MTGSGVIASAAKQTRDGETSIIVHSLLQATAVLTASARAGRPVVLVSPQHAGGYAGPGWFKEVVEAARHAVPEARCSALLDCGDNVGAALATIRAKVEGVIFTGRTDTMQRLADIARQHGLRFETERPAPALDLVADFFASREEIERRCAEVLG